MKELKALYIHGIFEILIQMKNNGFTRYRERLNKKYGSKPLIGSSWTFIKDGLDDFRDGKVPVIDSSSSIMIKGTKGVKPSIFGSASFDDQKPKQRIKKKFTKDHVVYSKLLPKQQQRKQSIENVEQNLLNHTLTLYPHIEESMAPGLFEEIVDLLDPSLALSDDISEKDENKMGNATPLSSSTALPFNESLEGEIAMRSNAGLLRGYKSDRKKQSVVNGSDEDISNKEEKSKNNRKNKSQLTEIESVTKNFCDWVRDLGGETNNLEESTINNLFASGYDAKPTLSVPVHVVELTNVPAELRVDGGSPTYKVKKLKEAQSYTPSWVKVKYGAWYLNPKTWSARPSNEPLQDPKDIEEKQMSDEKKKSKDLDKTLYTLHGVKAFKEFIDTKGTRNPEFLESVTISNQSSNVEEKLLKDTKSKKPDSVVR